jgi:hypothetical protein
VNRTVASYLVRKGFAYRISKALIKMREQAEEATHALISYVIDGPLGVGNLLPFSKPRCYGDKLHYETAMAGDGNWIDGYTPRRRIYVSSRSLFSNQVLPAARIEARV